MDRTAVEQWVAEYERLWRTPGTDQLADEEWPFAPAQPDGHQPQ